MLVITKFPVIFIPDHHPVYLLFIRNISPSKSSDRELLASYRQTGDLRVLADLYQRYMDLVYGVCLKYLADKEQSKDAVMSIFEELTEKLKTHEVTNFKSWLHTVTRNYCLMQLRTPRNMKTVEFSPDFMYSEDAVHLNGIWEKEEQLVRLEKCIQMLSEDQRRVIELFYIQQKCYDEIAEMTGNDWNKVRSYIQNGRRNLKICMEKDGEV